MPIIRLPIFDQSLFKEPVEKQVRTLADIVLRFRRELEWLLNGNLGEDNGVIKAEVAYIEQIFAEYITTNVLESNTIFTNNLNALKAYIARLTVDQLDTSDKVRNYIASDKSPSGYIRIYDQHIDFIDAQYVGDIGGVVQTEQATDNGTPLYWLNADQIGTGITTDVTAYPVMQYQYNELVKLRIFHEYDSTTGYYNPKIVLGAGSGTGNNAKGFIYKGATGLYFDYMHSTTGALRRIMLTDDGIDFSEIADGKVIYADQTIVEGVVQVFVDTAFPVAAKDKDVLIDTDDYSRYDKKDITTTTTLSVDDNEYCRCTGATAYTVTLHTATGVGVIKYIKNLSSVIITIAGTIDGDTNMYLYPKECALLICNGTAWDLAG